MNEGNRLVRNAYIDGWSNEYRKALVNDPGSRLGEKIADWRKRQEFDGPSLGQIPSGLVSAPVKVPDARQDCSHEMRFVAGMFGVSQDSMTLGLSPTFGWAITYDQPLPKKSPRPGFWSRRRIDGGL